MNIIILVGVGVLFIDMFLLANEKVRALIIVVIGVIGVLISLAGMLLDLKF